MSLTPEQAYRRAGGRRRYNRQRHAAAAARRREVERLLNLYGHKTRGVQARIARELGVSEATVSRDARWLEEFQSMYLLVRSGKVRIDDLY